MLTELAGVWLLVVLSVATPIWQPSYMFHSNLGRNIRHLPCVSRRSGESGTCMFAFSCAKLNGTHLGTCIDRFYFGSCCRVPDDGTNGDLDVAPPIDDNSLDGSSTTARIRPAVTQKPLSTTTTSAPVTTQYITVSTVSPTSGSTTTVQHSTAAGTVASSSTTTVQHSTAGPTTSTVHHSTSSSHRPPSRPPLLSSTTSGPTVTTQTVTTAGTSTVYQHQPTTAPPTFVTWTTIEEATGKPAPISIKPQVSESSGGTHKPIVVSSTEAPSSSKPAVTSSPTSSSQRPSPTPGRPPSPQRPASVPPSQVSPQPSRPPPSTHRPRPPPTQQVIVSTVKPPQSSSHRPSPSTKPQGTRPPQGGSTSTRPQQTDKPAPVTSKPTNTPKPQKPAVGTQKPVSGTQKPVSVTQKPAPGTQKPALGTQKPATGTQKPSGPRPQVTSPKPKPSQKPPVKPPVAKPKPPTKPKPTPKPTVRPTTKPTTTSTTTKPSTTTQNSTSETWVPISVSTHEPSSTSKPTTVKPETVTSPTTQGSVSQTVGPGVQSSSTIGVAMASVMSTTQSPSTAATTAGNITTTTPNYSDLLNMTNYKEVCGRRLFPESRVVGGDKSTFGKWPWQISLRQWRTSTYLHKCGAALLNENWAITAAHCVENVPPSDLLLRLGEHDLSIEDEPFGYQERRVQIVASHPQFDPRTFEYDLALLRFYEPVVFQPNIIPICVPTDDLNFVGSTAYVTGWGRLYEDGPLPSVLQEVSVPVINNTLCETMYRAAGYIEHIPDIFICAGWKKGGFDSCEGDSGGPMVIQRPDRRWLLAGVISWGIGCAEPNQPGVYTRISQFRHWINQILQF